VGDFRASERWTIPPPLVERQGWHESGFVFLEVDYVQLPANATISQLPSLSQMRRYGS
jgi:hypothetical protein